MDGPAIKAASNEELAGRRYYVQTKYRAFGAECRAISLELQDRRRKEENADTTD